VYILAYLLAVNTLFGGCPAEATQKFSKSELAIPTFFYHTPSPPWPQSYEKYSHET
jgi:hypothetical protein